MAMIAIANGRLMSVINLIIVDKSISYVQRCGLKGNDCVRQLSEVGNETVRFEFGDWNFGIPELDPDDRNSGSARHPYVGACIAHHDGGLHASARVRDRLL
jgi:hypothetical protein